MCKPYVALILAAALGLPVSAMSAADTGGKYPVRPIRFIVPFVAGAGTDITARTVAQKIAESLPAQLVVDNRPGAAGNIGMDIAAKAPSDGYTIVLVSATHSVNPALHKHLPYDLVRDFEPISQVTAQPYCLTVHPSVPATSVKQLVALIAGKPRYYTYGSSGTGGLSHLAGTLFGALAHVDWIHVPYKGGAAAINDLLGGQIHALFATIIGTRAHVNAGRLRWLAVSSAKRSQAVSELPTVAEAGLPGYAVSGWYGILAPARTPKPIIELLNKHTVAGLRSPDVAQRFSADGSEPVGSSPGEFAAHIKSEIEKNARLVKAAGMQAQ